MAKYAVVTSDTLNLRDAGSLSGKILTVLKKGAVLEILKEAGFDWLQVRVDGSNVQGFVSKLYVSLSDTRPGTPATPPAPTPAPAPAPSPAATPRAEVTTSSLNVRSGAGTNFSIITAVGQGTVFNVLSNQGGWVKIRVGMGEGYVSAQYVDLNTTKPSTSYLIEQAEFLSMNVVPSKLIPKQTMNSSEALVARIWNSYGGLLGKLADMLNVPLNGVVATLAAESGGNGFDANGRMIIRFENHIFYDYWGKNNESTFNRFYSFNRTAPASAWTDHMFRADDKNPMQGLHGNQDREWQALTIARALNDTAALSSISMGAPQVMGFNFRRLGYDNVQRMFNTLARGINSQLLAMFDFVKGMAATSPAIQALQRRDYLTFANIYNGPANAQTYRDIIQRYSDAFDRVYKTAV